MTMAPLAETPAEVDAPRPPGVRGAAGTARRTGRAGTDCPVLSMGMSGDFEAAIREGATHVRLGSVLFDGT